MLFWACQPLRGDFTLESPRSVTPVSASVLIWPPLCPSVSLSLLKEHSHWTVKVKVKSLSRVRLFVTPWTVAYQAPPSMGFSRQEYWSGLPFPSPGDLPDPGIEPGSPAFQADALTSEPPGKPRVPEEVFLSHVFSNHLLCVRHSC